MNNKLLTVAGLGIVLVLAVFGWQAFAKKEKSAETNSRPAGQTEEAANNQPDRILNQAEVAAVSQPGKTDTNSGPVETVKLSSSPAGMYDPGEIRVKLGTKVRIEGDPKTLMGGMDTMIIDGYGIRKVISPEDNIVEFTADKTGTFRMYCANGMGNGKLVVE